MRLNEIAPGEVDPIVTSYRREKWSAGSSNVNPKELRMIFKDLERECSDIINLYKKGKQIYGGYKFFYHGTSGRSADVMVYQGRSHTNRVSRDMPNDLHALLISTMQKVGFAAHRGNSIFVRSGDVRAYGPPYMIFPTNGFKYTFSPKIRDFYSTFLRNDNRINVLRQIKDNPQALKHFYFTDLEFKKTNLIEALVSDSEVMMSGKYYALYDKYLSDKIYNWLEELG